MKYFYGLLLVCVSLLPAHAYQAGAANRTNFGSAQQAQPQQQFRAFSNYNNRNWGQGVQTQTVQTEVAGTSAVDFDKKTPQQLVAKTQAATAKPAKAPQPATTPAATPQPAANVPANVDPAAMMQQVQGMMSAMGNMAGSNAQPGAQPNTQAAAAMPAGMPDISALMGGAMPTAPAAPAKK